MAPEYSTEPPTSMACRDDRGPLVVKLEEMDGVFDVSSTDLAEDSGN